MNRQYRNIVSIFISVFLIHTALFCRKNPVIPEPINSEEIAKIPFDKLSGKIAFKRALEERPDEYFFILLDGNLKTFTIITTFYTNIPGNLMVSPEGTQILFSYFIFKGQIQSFLWQIYLLDIEAQTIKNATPSLYDDSYGAWSPDGEKIAFWSNRNLQSSIWLVDLAEDSSYHLVDVNYATRTRPAWFSDGSNLVYASTDSNFKVAIFKLNLVTRSSEKLYNEEFTTNDVIFKHPDISPDDKYLCFVKSYRSTYDEIWILNLQNKEANRITTGAADWHTCWSPDGQKIVFSRDNHLFIINKDGSDLTQITFGDHLDECPSWCQ